MSNIYAYSVTDLETHVANHSIESNGTVIHRCEMPQEQKTNITNIFVCLHFEDEGVTPLNASHQSLEVNFLKNNGQIPVQHEAKKVIAKYI